MTERRPGMQLVAWDVVPVARLNRWAQADDAPRPGHLREGRKGGEQLLHDPQMPLAECVTQGRRQAEVSHAVCAQDRGCNQVLGRS